MAQDQAALPAWLESLRVGERAPRPTSKPPQFSPADLMEDGSLPSWMHAQRNETQDVTGANLLASLRPSALPGPNTDNTSSPATSFAAQSLIDEQSLPSWMQALPAENGTAASNRVWMQERQPSTPLPSMGPISAGDLVNKDNVPDWMKSLQQQSGPAGQGQPKQIVNTEMPPMNVEALLPSQALGFAARDLVDQQSLPSWLTQLGKQAPTASANRDQSMPSPSVNERSEPIEQGQKGFAAQSLIDEQSLPSWMVQQSDQNALALANGEQAKRSGQSGTGLPASSLLDMNALPSWLVQNGQAQTASPAYPQPSNSNQPWSPQQPTAQGAPADLPSGPAGRLAASSIIDMNALPEWLRSSGEQQSVQEQSSQQYSAPYAGPPRVENVRVPSRPRGEISSSETSEMAASVFASMLGVASTAPNFSPPSGIAYQQSVQPTHVEQMTLSGVSGLAAMPGQGGSSMASVGSNQGGTNMGGMPGVQGGQSMGGMPVGSGIHSMPGVQGGQSMGGMPVGQGGQSMSGIPGGSGVYSMPGVQGGQSMGGMPVGQGGQSMSGIPGGSGVYSMPGVQGGQSMGGMPVGQGGQSMSGIPGGSGVYSMPGGQGGQSMGGMPVGQGGQSVGDNTYRNPTGALTGPNASGMAREEKNMKKRGLFGALLDWLSR
jgi:hypothetical protein